MSDRQETALPEITPAQLAEWMQERSNLILLDVREPYEFPRAKIDDARVVYAPLSELARKHLEGLPEKAKVDRSAPMVVFCHHGSRSAQVTGWLLSLGWGEVFNLAGGIDAYARQVDQKVGRY